MAQLRPTLLTIICIYEGLAGLITLGGEAFSQFLFYTVTPGAHTFHINPVHTAVVLLSSLLSLAIAATLWPLRREAFFLSLAKFFVSLFATASVLYVLINSPLHTADSIGRSPNAIVFSWLPRLFDAVFLLLNIAITIYIYRITIGTCRTLVRSGD